MWPNVINLDTWGYYFFVVVFQLLSHMRLFVTPMDCSTGFPILQYLPEFAQTHIHWVRDAIQPCHYLLSPFPPDLSPSQHQGLFQWISSLQQVAKVLELQHQSFQRIRSDQIRSVAQLCPTLCDPMNRSTPGLPVHHQFLEFTETHVHRVSDAIQPSHPLSSPSPLAPNPSQHRSLFQWVNSSHEVAKVLEF